MPSTTVRPRLTADLYTDTDVVDARAPGSSRPPSASAPSWPC